MVAHNGSGLGAVLWRFPTSCRE